MKITNKEKLIEIAEAIFDKALKSALSYKPTERMNSTSKLATIFMGIETLTYSSDWIMPEFIEDYMKADKLLSELLPDSEDKEKDSNEEDKEEETKENENN